MIHAFKRFKGLGGISFVFTTAIFATQTAHAQEEEDLSITGGVYTIAQSVSDAKAATNGGEGDSINYAAELFIKKQFESSYALIHFIGAQGMAVYEGANSITMYSNENGDVQTTGAWYSHTFLDMFTITFGKAAPSLFYDNNAYASSYSSQFFANSFVNNPAIMFPGHVPGLDFKFTYEDVFAFQFGVFEDSSPEIVGEMENKFFIGEARVSYAPFDADGNLRLTAWNSGANDQSGFAINMDQSLGEMFGVFSRLGFISGAEGNDTESAFSFGGQMAFGEGHILGVGYTAQVPANPSKSTQNWFESYLSFALTDSISITGDIQFVGSPGFESTADTLSIYGIRVRSSF